jgi:acetoin utilization deacetylase AcuC-like enzyme
LGLESTIFNITRDRGIGRQQAGLDVVGWAKFTEELIHRHQPGLILYQAGADAWIDDPYGCGYLTFDELGYRDKGIFSACQKFKIPTAWNLAGGYSNPMDMTVAIHLQTLEASDRSA